MTIEHSHGKPRVTGPRLRDVNAAAADGEPIRDRDARGRFAPGNSAGRNRIAKRSITAVLRSAVAAGVAGVVATPNGSAPAPAQIAQQALALYRAGKRDLRTDSPIALSHLVRWAVNSALAQHLEGLAAEYGLDTDHGLRLLERAHACEGRAERASVAALTMAQAMRARQPAGPTPMDAIEQHAAKILAEQEGEPR